MINVCPCEVLRFGAAQCAWVPAEYTRHYNLSRHSGSAAKAPAKSLGAEAKKAHFAPDADVRNRGSTSPFHKVLATSSAARIMRFVSAILPPRRRYSVLDRLLKHAIVNWRRSGRHLPSAMILLAATFRHLQFFVNRSN
jgi:hypothetical protein